MAHRGTFGVVLVIALLSAALAGCLGAAEPDLRIAPASEDGRLDLSQVHQVRWEGRVAVPAPLDEPLGRAAHTAETERLVAPLSKEGFLFDIARAPEVLQVALDWSSQPSASVPEMMLVLRAPRSEPDDRAYQTPFSSAHHACLRIPGDGIVPGSWQFMAHSRNVQQGMLVVTVTTLGGLAAIQDGPHGRAATDGSEGHADLAPALPCIPGW